jgi:TetR/AcrR family acrAB operon transcriptional repressor
MRRTKEQAEETRRRIMAAGLSTFDRLGIARTTLERVAEAAGVTRGAIYWHFPDKQALVRAIRDEVSLPLVDKGDLTLLEDRATAPLDRIERFLLDLLHAVEADSRTRRVFSVMSFKCEYVGAFERELQEYAEKLEHVRGALTEVYSEARSRKQMRAGLPPEIAAMETTLFLAGLMRLCLLKKFGARVRKQAALTVAAHVAGRRAAPAPRRTRLRARA